jgi:hypothetical protein
MTTYQAISGESEYHLIVFWQDLPEPTAHHVTTFRELKPEKRRGELAWHKTRRVYAWPK